MKRIFFLSTLTLFALSCSDKDLPVNEHELVFELKLDPAQERLDNFGLPSVIPANHAAQTPVFREMGIHYLELLPESNTPYGTGKVIYQSPETNAGGNKAIDFEQLELSKNGDPFAKIKLSELPPGTYKWIRASVAYQSYDIKFNISDLPSIGALSQQTGVINSFLGYNTYIKSIQPRSKMLTVNGNRLQGFWVFESDLPPQYAPFNKVFFGQSPNGATTVVNPLFQSSPIPAGSCVVTGQLVEPLVITGEEQEDIVLVLSFSTNKSLEWVDENDNNELDFYGTGNTPNERIVDMGIRGLKCSIKK